MGWGRRRMRRDGGGREGRRKIGMENRVGEEAGRGGRRTTNYPLSVHTHDTDRRTKL